MSVREKQLFDALQIWEVLLGGRSYPLNAFSFLGLHVKTVRRHLHTLERIPYFKVKHTNFEGTTYWRSDYQPRSREPVFTHKKCCGCGKRLPISNFGRNRSTADKHHAYCRDCRHDYFSIYYRNNEEHIKKKERERYKKRRTKLLAYQKRHYQEQKASR